MACRFCGMVTAGFRIPYVFVALEVGSRRLLHVNATAHPTAAWTVQQVQEILTAFAPQEAQGADSPRDRSEPESPQHEERQGHPPQAERHHIPGVQPDLQQ